MLKNMLCFLVLILITLCSAKDNNSSSSSSSSKHVENKVSLLYLHNHHFSSVVRKAIKNLLPINLLELIQASKSMRLILIFYFALGVNLVHWFR